MKAPLVICALLLLFPAAAHAYLDAGSGSYFAQVVLAAIVGVLCTVKGFFKRKNDNKKR